MILGYDEAELRIPSSGTLPSKSLDYDEAQNSISLLKHQLAQSKEASDLFGKEREKGLEGI